MERKKTKLMIEDNTIYEIDLECLRQKEEQERRRKSQVNIRGGKGKKKGAQ